ncbi:MFS transporter [Luteimonas sp. SJ-92]|uniref:MFS transporter n=1 Tax=Luteimonas salinisoli TaxID=2752307 RepID=A0A853JGW0_9GAMM|nr:MFS transporter [Luteimonas salinisoli]NZA28626.1 MFS transporter [Luteimonas salinisoli]
MRPLLSLLSGVALLLLGSGLLNTLIPLRGSQLGYSETLIGGFTSAYFAGFFVGTYLAPRLIRRIGHIRAFAFYTACSACVVLLHALSADPLLWLAARLGLGIALVGLYTVIESWLGAQAEPQQRGRAFATYMVVNLGALALAQQLLRIEAGADFVLFVVVALLICAASLPVLLTTQALPQLQPAPRLHLRRLFAAAPTAGTGALLSGLAMGAFWGLLPAFFIQRGMGAVDIGTLMSVAILGGAALQLPLGRLSDRHDRRFALALVSAAACVFAALIPVLMPWPGATTVLIFLYGGMAFSIYPIVVAHLLDHLPPEDMLSASSSVLLLNGAGSAIGPLAAGLLMAATAPAALFGWFALLLGALALYAGYRYQAFRRVQTHGPAFVPMLRTTPASLEMLATEAGEQAAEVEEAAQDRSAP